MKQSFASATGLRGGGPILVDGAKARVRPGLPPPRIVLGTGHLGRVAGTEALEGLLTLIESRRLAQHDAARDLTGLDQTPQRDEQLSREGDDHCFLSHTRSFDAAPEPRRQSALLLMLQEAPGEFDHSAPHARISG
jgi:hypothetical protein